MLQRLRWDGMGREERSEKNALRTGQSVGHRAGKAGRGRSEKESRAQQRNGGQRPMKQRALPHRDILRCTSTGLSTRDVMLRQQRTGRQSRQSGETPQTREASRSKCKKFEVQL